MGIKRTKIYKWKKELKLNKNKSNNKNNYEKKKREFIVRIDEFKRMCKNGKQKQFAKELGISRETLRKWKKEFGIEIDKSKFNLNLILFFIFILLFLVKNAYSNEEKMSKMNDYLKIKNANPSLSDKEIATFLKISLATLNRWKQNL